MQCDDPTFATDSGYTIECLINFNITDPNVQARFVERDVTPHHFEYLSEADQRDLMPKLIDRLHFRRGLIDFKKINQVQLDLPETVQNSNDFVNI